MEVSCEGSNRDQAASSIARKEVQSQVEEAYQQLNDKLEAEYLQFPKTLISSLNRDQAKITEVYDNLHVQFDQAYLALKASLENIKGEINLIKTQKSPKVSKATLSFISQAFYIEGIRMLDIRQALSEAVDIRIKPSQINPGSLTLKEVLQAPSDEGDCNDVEKAVSQLFNKAEAHEYHTNPVAESKATAPDVWVYGRHQ